MNFIVMPPGPHSPRTDEYCFTYCSQSIAGRVHKRDPWCRSICIRKVFAHEVRNVLGYPKHRSVDADGRAKYPLPPEGQRPLGIFSEKGRPWNHTKHWEEGWYLWYSKNRWSIVERLDLMCNLERQSVWDKLKESRKMQWEEWERQRKMAKDGSKLEPRPEPPRPFPEFTGQTLLIHLPPPLPPIYDQIQTLLRPTYKTLKILHQSFESGAQLQLASRLWDKAWTGEPFKLAMVVCSKMWEKWKEGPPDGKKDV